MTQIEEIALLQRRIEEITRSTPGNVSEDSGGQVSFALVTGTESTGTMAQMIESVGNTLAKISSQATLKSGKDKLQAVTSLGYVGQIVSVWSENPEVDVIDSHLASVQGAVNLRTALIRLVVSISFALTSISVAIANPLTAFTALGSVRELKQAIERFAVIASESRLPTTKGDEVGIRFAVVATGGTQPACTL